MNLMDVAKTDCKHVNDWCYGRDQNRQDTVHSISGKVGYGQSNTAGCLVVRIQTKQSRNKYEFMKFFVELLAKTICF